MPVRVLCRALDVSPSGFYAWCRRPESAHGQRDRQLSVLIRASHEASRCRYGSPRVHEDLIEQGVLVSRKRVVRLMQAEGLRGRMRKRFKQTTMSEHDHPVAANVLAQQFVADAPESALGGWHDGVRDRWQRHALPGGGPRPLLPVPRRLGPECRQRPASRHQRRSRWR